MFFYEFFVDVVVVFGEEGGEEVGWVGGIVLFSGFDVVEGEFQAFEEGLPGFVPGF